MESGRLEERPTAELCRVADAESRTGCLRITAGEQHARIYFRRGRVYTATAPSARTRLGDRLLGGRHITQDQLDRALRMQARAVPAPRLGELLVQDGLDREALRACVQAQITDSVAAALSWSVGRWSFVPGERVVEDVPLGLGVPELLMEGARRLQEWEMIRRRLGSVGAVVDFDAGRDPAHLSLSADEWAMLTRIDGAASVAEIAADSGYGQLETARIVYGLLTAGIVRVVAPGPPLSG